MKTAEKVDAIMAMIPETPNEVPSSEGLGLASERDCLALDRMQTPPGLRLFVRRGATTWFARGFCTKAAADDWIDWHRRRGLLDWRAGWLFRLRGDPRDIEIVNRKGERLKA